MAPDRARGGHRSVAAMNAQRPAQQPRRDAVRVSLAPTSAAATLPPMVVEAMPVPESSAPDGPRTVIVDGEALERDVRHLDDERLVIIRASNAAPERATLLPGAPVREPGAVRRDVV